MFSKNLTSQRPSFAANSFKFALITLAIILVANCGGDGGTSLVNSDEAPDPVLLDIPIAYIKRPVPTTAQRINNIADPIEMFPGARLLVNDRASNLAQERDITEQILAIVASEENADPALIGIDIKDLETSFDGQQLIFSVRAIPDIANNDEPELFTWNLWTYDFQTDTANYLIPSKLIRNDGAASGGGHDMAPHFLTDDRIVFSSSRQSAIQEKQLNEGRGQRYAPVSELDANVQAVALHIYDPDNDEISQISINRGIDLDPATLESGEIIFSRWNTNNQIGLYKINPSGAQLSVVYGYDSGDLLATEESSEGNTDRLHFLQPRQLDDGRILAFIRAENQTQLGGDFVFIDTEGFIDLFTPINSYSGAETRAQTTLTDLEVNALDELSLGGKFLAAYPLRDGSQRLLVSWSSCRVENGEGLIIPCSIADSDDAVMINGQLRLRAAPPLFGLWIYDPIAQNQLPVVVAEQGFIISEVVAAEARSYPTTPDETDIFDASLAAENQGLLIIDSVYNEDGVQVPYAPLNIASYAEPGTALYEDRPARFLRVLQPVPIPNDDVLDNPSNRGAFGLLEILGYVPVEPDGSVGAKVPANTPIMINVVDRDGRRISRRHTHWLQVARGEIVRCVGCHNPNSDVPHGRLDSQPTSQNPGAVSLSSGLEGFLAADPSLFASTLGQTMAEVYNLRRPVNNPSETVRDIQLEITYSDEWTDTNTLTPDADIDLSYDPAWDIPAANAIIAPNLDPALQGRIVIHYGDHIQPIWEREREISIDGNDVLNQQGEAVTNCIGCHTSNGNTQVPAGQLELTGEVIGNGLITTSYQELLFTDAEQWLSTSVPPAAIDRQLTCTQLDPEGNVIPAPSPAFPVRPSINRRSANNSNAFFNCFEIDDSPSCGAFVQDLSPPPPNCTADGGIVVEDGALTTKVTPATFAEAELRMNALDPMTPALSLTDNGQLMNLLNVNCESCHSTVGGQIPHSDSDSDTAYLALSAFINLVNPGNSQVITRLSINRHGPTGNHSCADIIACDNLATALQQAITTFADAVPAEEINNVIPGGQVSAQGTFNHYNLLTPAELRLISEWIDIGTPIYTDPFDPRLYD